MLHSAPLTVSQNVFVWPVCTNQLYSIVGEKIPEYVSETNKDFMFISLQCGRQIAQLKEEYEETKKTLEEQASKLRQVSIDKMQTKSY